MPFFVLVMFVKVMYEAIRALSQARTVQRNPNHCVWAAARARAVCRECAACDLLRIWRGGAFYEIGCAVLHRLSARTAARSRVVGFVRR